jgi:hypothetical protein
MLTKSGAAKVGRRSRRVNDNRRQIPVAFEVHALDVENRLDSVTCQKRLGFRQRRIRPDFFRRPAAVQPHRPFYVVPFAKNVQFALNMILPGKEHGQPLPKLERFEEPFALPVELFGTVFAAFDQINFQFFEKSFEFGSELTTVVGDDEPGRAALFDRVFDQRDHVPGSRRIFVNTQSQQLPAETVHNGGDIKADKQQIHRGQVKVPSAVDGFRAQIQENGHLARLSFFLY